MKRPIPVWIACICGVGLATVLASCKPEDDRQWKLTGAAGRGDLAEVKRLFAEGANLDASPRREGTEGGSPALLEAAAAGHEDVVRFFVEHGANLEISFSDSNGPLAAAIGNRDYSTAELLLTHGASVNRAVGQILSANNWSPPLDPKMYELLKSYGAVTQTSFKRVPPSPFLCTGQVITEAEIMTFLDRKVPYLYAALASTGSKPAGLLHVNYTGRNLKHPGPFYIEVAVPFDYDKYQVPNGFYFRTAAEFKCFAGETSASRKNIACGTGIIESKLWSEGKAYPTYDMREVYRRWVSSDSKENIVEIQFGVHHPSRGVDGKLREDPDSIQYEVGE